MRRMAFLVAGVLCCGSVFAGEFIVPLPGLHGYYTAGTTRTVSFNAGHSFSAIRSVRLELAGIHNLGWCNGVECPLHLCSISYRAAMGSDSSSCLCCWKINNTFDPQWADFYESKPMQYPTAPWCPAGNWDFLLDGSDELSLSFTHGMSFCTVLISGSAVIEFACLSIDADTVGVGISKPLAGQMLLAGSVYPIQWKDFHDSACQGDYLLQYSVDDGQTWLPMASVSQTCTYAWELPDITSAACVVKLIKDDGSGMEAVNGPFSIYQCQEDMSGDFLRDCYVNLGDFAVLASNWLAGPLCPDSIPGEMDGDCTVQLSDLLSFTENWLACANPLDLRCGQ